MPADSLDRRRRSRISRMSTRLQLQQPITSDDGQGGRAITWTTLATVWAAIEPQVGFADAEAWRLDQTASRVKARIWLRTHATASPAPGMRLHNPASGDIWRIETVADADGQRHHLVCLCSAEPQ